jgi:hypothetical protein
VVHLQVDRTTWGASSTDSTTTKHQLSDTQRPRSLLSSSLAQAGVHSTAQHADAETLLLRLPVATTNDGEQADAVKDSVAAKTHSCAEYVASGDGGTAPPPFRVAYAPVAIRIDGFAVEGAASPPPFDFSAQFKYAACISDYPRLLGINEYPVWGGDRWIGC